MFDSNSLLSLVFFSADCTDLNSFGSVKPRRMNKTINTGSTPTTYNIFQPNVGMITAAKIAAKAAPTCAPIPATEEARQFVF